MNKFKVGDMVKMQDSSCDCPACERASSGYHKVVELKEVFGEDAVTLEGLTGYFPIQCADWLVKPRTLENK